MRKKIHQYLHHHWPAGLLCLLSVTICWSFVSTAVMGGTETSVRLRQGEESELQARVIEIFRENCARAGCHTGTTPMMGLKLTPDEFYSRTVNQPSQEVPGLMRVNPGNPDSSYLVKKILGTEDIIGLRMPFGRDPLSEEQIATIVEWVKNLKEPDSAVATVPIQDPLIPFYGWRVVNLPTTRMVDAGNWLFYIGHRFFPPIDAGYQALFGLDGSANIFLNLGYAITDNLLLNLGRSNVENNVELYLKYGIKRQYPVDKLPFAAAFQAAVNWNTEKISDDQDVFRSEAFKFSGQLILASQLIEGVAVAVVPGILFNPDIEKDGEDPLVTIGLAGRVHVWRSISLIGEWVPIVAGYTLTNTAGEFNRFDSWGGGIELAVGGHAFQIVVSNSYGLTSDQYMRGGSFDISEGDIRLGFNIFRPLQF